MCTNYARCVVSLFYLYAVTKHRCQRLVRPHFIVCKYTNS